MRTDFDVSFGTGDVVLPEHVTQFAAPISALELGTAYYAEATGATNTFAVAMSPAFTALETGMIVNFRANAAVTGPATLAVDGLTAKPIVKNATEPLAADDVLYHQVVSVIYDGTNFQILSGANRDRNIDGGSAASVYLPSQNIDGGGA